MKQEGEFYTVRGYRMLNAENRLLTPSMEDYMEMIYRTCIEEGYERINGLAEKLNVRPSSATKVIQKLRQTGLVDYRKYGIIQLTEEGRAIGRFLLRRHGIIEDFLKNLGIIETLLKDTEMIEHDVSLNTLRSIYVFNRFLEENPDIRVRYETFRKEFDRDIDLSYPQQT